MDIGTVLFSLISNYGVFALLGILIVEESGVPLPIPGDALLLFAGFLVNEGVLSLPMVVISSFSGVMIGSTILYSIAHHGGRPLIRKYGKYIFFPEDRLEHYSELFRRHSHAAIIIGRFLPGMRVVFSLIAGLMGVPRKQFLGQVAIASSIWICGLVGTGMYLGSRWQNASELFSKYWYIFVIFFVLMIVISIFRASHSSKQPQSKAHRKMAKK